MSNKILNMAGLRRRPHMNWAKRPVLGLSLLVGIFALVGCSQGSYPLDIFYEMHYQPTYKSHEPPRLSVPESAVPWFAAPVATSFGTDGRHLYEVNCSQCHGIEGKGDGSVLQKMQNTYGYNPALPADLTQAPAPTSAQGVEGFMRNGLVIMPNFSKLLTDDEMNLVAEYVVNCLQGQQPQACP